jgi:superfamily II DNA or RNA helicase
MIQLGEVKRVLVVGPLRPIYTVWGPERKLWGFPQQDIILHGQYAQALAMGLQVEYVNYAGLHRIEDLDGRWDLIIVDESTFAKNWMRKRSKRLQKMIKHIPYRIILTGTPASNSLADLHAQIYLLDEGKALGKNVTEFRRRFCRQGGFRGRQWIIRSSVKKELCEAIDHLVLRMKAEDYLDMPKLIFNNIWTKMPDSSYSQYKRLKRELFAELESGEVFAATAGAAYTKCKQFANGQVYSTDEDGTKHSHVAHREKVKALYELHEELAGKPLMIFYHYKHDVEQIKVQAGSPFKNTPVIRGGMKPNEVSSILDDWNAGKLHAILAQWQAVSHGLNMQKGGCADLACFGVPDSLDVFEQAYRRVYRQGNDESHVRVHRLLTLGTVEETQLERLEGKHKTQSSFLSALKRHAKVA